MLGGHGLGLSGLDAILLLLSRTIRRCIWMRFIANLSFLGMKASAGTDPGLMMSFSRSGLICLRTSDSFGYFRTHVSISLANWLVEYCPFCIGIDFRVQR